MVKQVRHAALIMSVPILAGPSASKVQDPERRYNATFGASIPAGAVFIDIVRQRAKVDP